MIYSSVTGKVCPINQRPTEKDGQQIVLNFEFIISSAYFPFVMSEISAKRFSCSADHRVDLAVLSDFIYFLQMYRKKDNSIRSR